MSKAYTQMMSYQGIVYKKTSGSYEVRTDGRTIACTLSNHANTNAGSSVNGKSKNGKGPKKQNHADTVAIGDAVQFIETPNGAGTITEVLPRRNKLSRRAVVTGTHDFEQVIVANVDQVVPVFAAARPAPHWNMLDRYLVAAESHGLPSVICITKLDLVQSESGAVDEEILEAVAEYRRIGYPVVMVSAETGQGLAALQQVLRGKVSVLVGKSGVGKTTLLNAVQPGLGLKVNAVSQGKIGKGRHTTTHLEMFPLELDKQPGAVIDTPGVREFGLWEIYADDLALHFPEMSGYVGRCRFGLDCEHDEEPGCAVRQAVVGGQISPRRYQSYLRLKEETLL